MIWSFVLFGILTLFYFLQVIKAESNVLQCNAMAFSDCIYIYMMKSNIVKYVF